MEDAYWEVKHLVSLSSECRSGTSEKVAKSFWTFQLSWKPEFTWLVLENVGELQQYRTSLRTSKDLTWQLTLVLFSFTHLVWLATWQFVLQVNVPMETARMCFILLGMLPQSSIMFYLYSANPFPLILWENNPPKCSNNLHLYSERWCRGMISVPFPSYDTVSVNRVLLSATSVGEP